MVENEEKIQTIAVEQMTETIKKYLKEHKINKYEISGRTKSIYSIYKKMVFQNRAFEDIYDI